MGVRGRGRAPANASPTELTANPVHDNIRAAKHSGTNGPPTEHQQPAAERTNPTRDTDNESKRGDTLPMAHAPTPPRTYEPPAAHTTRTPATIVTATPPSHAPPPCPCVMMRDMVTPVDAPTTHPPQRPVLRPDQERGLKAAVRHLRRPSTRALLVSATGTGKTLLSIRVADALVARLVLVVVPTLDLTTQTALAWRRDGHAEHMVIVSSMDTSAHGALAAHHVGSTSNSRSLAALMSVVGEREDQLPALTVICTYDSLDKIEGTQHTPYRVPPFDLAIMDEAHRIAGRADKKWAAVNDTARIRADRRLYMTATPRSFAAPDLADSADTSRPRPRRRTLQPSTDLSVNSMDNEAVYGKKIFDYPLAQAIEDGVAADYRIIVPTITDTELRTRLNSTTPGTSADSADTQDALRTTALHLAVLKTMSDHKLRRVLVFFHLVEDARRLTRELGHTLRRLRQADPQAFPGLQPTMFFVHGDHTPDQRAQIFTDFAASTCAILTNAKVIAEGVDIPSVDAVIFADPTSSVIRCVQGLGRALRLDVSGKTASLVVPVYIPPDADSEDILGTAYEPVWAITTALASHDHRILERLPNKANRLPAETSRLIGHRWHFDFTIHPVMVCRRVSVGHRHLGVSGTSQVTWWLALTCGADPVLT